MDDKQKNYIDNLIEETASHVMKQQQLENEARVRADLLRYFKSQLEDLRLRLLHEN